jgi:tetratricopeptide (TPR) repeat protein
MKRWVGTLGLAAIFSLAIPNALAAEVLTNDAVVTMVTAGLGAEIILEKIKTSQAQFDHSVQGLVRLKESGVSETIIRAMMEASAPTAVPGPVSPQAVAQERQDAISLYRQGKVAQAEAAFDRLLAARPGDDDLKVWKALAMPDLPATLGAETLYKLGRLSADLEKKPRDAREYWERAVAADPSCRYGMMAQNRLKAGPAR